MDFQSWLVEHSIDCQTLTPEVEQALRSQFDAEQKRLTPVAEKLVSPADCLWPSRNYHQAVLFDHTPEYQ